MESTTRSFIGKVVAITIVALPFLSANGYAHEGHHDAAMQKLHKIMPMYAQAQAKINEALANGDAATVKTTTDNILKTLPDLKRSKPHKNLKEVGAFREIATAFGGDVKKTAELAKAGDFVKAKEAFQHAQNRCNECHVKFRD